MENLKLIKIHQKFDNKKLNNIPEFICKELKRIQLDRKIMPGMKVGITVGSRGIDNLQLIIKSIIYEIKKRKGIPFIVTSMGSHGGATAEGQKEILTNYGITEESMGVPIKASMEVVKLGRLENGLPVYFDKIAYNADGIIVVNRVKVHTAFKAEIESGLHKMLSVGLGNHEGAKLVHYLGVKGIQDYMVEFAEVILKKAPILAGFAILENAYDETYKIVGAKTEEFYQVEKELLKECKQILPQLPVKNIDILIIQEMGKNISGTGMDTNIIGGIKGFKKGEYEPPQIKKILVLDLTPETHGNALGVGMAHMITKRLYEKIDLKATNMNTITTTFLDRARIPMAFDTDKEAIEVGLKTIWNLPGTKPRIIIIKNTLKLDQMYVTEPIWEEIKSEKNITSSRDWEEINFDNLGNLLTRI
ncbi:DUF2088 domain-containing protein [Candidatus Atribacteria bacterium HGW-Atribacteria-1]|nr:MAG: DUF2088 domain-containing protein [Candidatus Atribacteria bacterium HGW-Atribacteria-1]